MQIAGASRYFQAIAGHDLEGALAQTEAIRGKQNVRVALGHIQGQDEEFFEIAFDLKRLAAMRA